MNVRSLAAGSVRISRQFFFLLLIATFFFSCRTQHKEEDPRITELQKDVKQLSEENRKLLEEIQTLRQELKRPPAEPPSPARQTIPSESDMTMEQMKAGVQPLLEEIIANLKKTADTPKKENQYGTRVEYDLKNAVYGLVKNQEELVPTAKVIVQYEKFLESGKDSRSIGAGNSTFLFVYRNGRWVLQNYE